MSFSQKCKNELARKVPQGRCCRLAELSALVRLDGTIKLEAGRRMSLLLDTENAAVARKAIKFIKLLFELETETMVRRKHRLRKNNIYRVEIQPQHGLVNMLQQTGVDLLMSSSTEDWRESHLRKSCCRKAYLRGAFLAGGSITNPQGGSYHLELQCFDPEMTKLLVDLMRGFDLKPGTTRRKEAQLIYLKEAEQIINFLSIVGAHTAVLNFESVRIYKDIRNRVNRLVNCETANLNKTIEAAARQIEAIQRLAVHLGLEQLSPALREIALLRLEHPEVSIKELGELVDPPLTKSAINHRLRRIEQLAENCGKREAAD